MKNVFKILFVMLIAFVLIGCGGGSTAESISVSGTSATLGVGSTMQMTATVSPSKASQEVTWSVDKAAVATIDANGVLTGVSEGTVVVTATSKEVTTVTGNCTITVSAIDVALNEKYTSVCENKTVYLTTVGQADIDTTQNIIEAAGVTEDQFSREDLLEASGCAEGSVVILVTGTSSKGLGSAGTDVAKETSRAQGFVSAAEAGKITLIVVHIGGATRRGDLTDPILRVVCPSADLLLVVQSGNADGLFTGLAKENSVDLYLYSKMANMKTAFVTLYNITE